jgi:prephenate dehydrogenase
LFCLTPSVKAEPDAVKLASDLVAVLGARPLFLDPVEHDGLMAAVEQLPTLLALALMDTVIHQASWREMRKVAGTSFDLSTRLTLADPVSIAELCLSNRDNLVRWIDTFSGTLASIRHNLVEQNADQVREIAAGAVRERERWVQDRASGTWETGPAVEMPRSNVFADAFLGSWLRKRPKKDK